jgi:hypothetical protein
MVGWGGQIRHIRHRVSKSMQAHHKQRQDHQVHNCKALIPVIINPKLQSASKKRPTRGRLVNEKI